MNYIKLFTLSIFAFLIGCSNVDNDEMKPAVNYIYSKTIVQSILDKNVKRKFWVRLPQNISKSQYPIVMFFHGAGGNAYDFYNNSIEIKNLIDNEEFIGIFPDGNLKGWNCGFEESKADDIGFLNKIVEDLKNNTLPSNLMNFNKTYGIGISNGALFINKVAKETKLFSGIAPIISQQSDVISKINSKRSLSVYQINGTSDDLIPFEGGSSMIGHTFVSAKKSAENWVKNSNCELNNIIETEHKWGDFSVSSFLYGDCDNNHIIKYHLVKGAGHQANFGGGDLLYSRIWDFLKEH